MSDSISILLLEASPADAQLIQLNLIQQGINAEFQQVETETDFAAALAANPDLIIADYSLPKFDGLRALKILRERGLDIPFIFISGTYAEEAVAGAFQLGAHDFLVKDRLARLGMAVQHVLEEKRLRAEKKHSGEALQKSEERYRSLFNTMEEAIAINEVIFDENGDAIDYVILDVNAAFEKHSPYKIEEAFGNRATVLYQMSPDFIRGWWREHIQKDHAAQTEYYHDPSGRWFFITTTVPENGRFATIFINITERKQAGEALRESEEKYRAFFQNSMDAILLTAPDGSILSANPAACKMLGRTEAEICSLGRNGVVDTNDPRLADLLAERAGTGSANGELTMIRIDGSPFPVEVSTQLFKDRLGNLRTSMIIRDIAERKQAEQALHDSRNFLQATVNSLSSHIAILDENGNILTVNAAWQKFGAENDLIMDRDGVGANYLDICDATTGKDASDAQTMARFIRQILAGEIAEAQFEYPCDSPWERRWFITHLTGFTENGKMRAVVAHENITERKLAEERLLQSEIRHRNIFNTVAVSIWEEDYSEVRAALDELQVQGITDFRSYLTGHPEFVERAVNMVEVLDVNEATLKSYGAKDKTELLGNLGKLIKPESFQDELIAFAEGRSYFEKETDETGLDGKPTSFWLTMTFYTDTVGKHKALVSVNNITERKQAEAALRKTQDQLALAVRSANGGLWDWDLQTNKVFYSDEWKSLLGYQTNEVLDEFSEWERLVHPDDREPALKLVDAYLERPYPNFQNEFRMLHKDGEYRWILSQASLITNEQGKPIRMLGSHIDVSHRKQAERALRESEANLNALIENVDGLIWSVDERYRLITSNSQFQQSVHRAIGRETKKGDTLLFEELPNEYTTLWRERYDRALRGENFDIADKERYLTDQQFIEYRISPIWDHTGSIVGVTIFGLDITERKLAEDRLRQSEAQFFNAFHMGPVGMAITRLSDGKFIDANSSFLNMLEFERAEAIGHTSVELGIFSAEERQRLAQEQSEQWGLQNFETLAQTKSGRVIDLLFSSRLTEINGDACILSILNDITERKQMENVLRASQEQLKSILETAPDYVLRIERDGKIAFINHTYPGVTIDQVIGTDILNWIPPGYRPEFQAMMTKAFDDGLPAEMETVGSGADNKPVWYFSRVGPVMENGEVTALIMVGQDITERKQSEDASRESEQKFSILFEKAAFSAALSRLDDGVIININEAFETALGYTKWEAIGKTAWELGINSDLESRMRLLAEAQTQGSMRDMELVLRTKSGVERRFLLTMDLVNISSQKYVLSMAQDITERKQAENDLRFHASIVKSASDAIIGKTVDGIIISWNPGAEKLYGYTADEVIGKSITIIAPPERPDDIPAILETIRQGGGVEHYETIRRAKNGRRIEISLTVSPILNDQGQVVGASAISRDITERKQAEGLLKEAEEKYRNLVERLPLVVYTSELGMDGMWFYVSPQIEQLLGYTPDEWLADSKLWYARVHPDDRDKQEAIEEQASTESAVFDSEYRIVRRDEKEIWVRDSGFISAAPAGSQPVVQGIITDITERKLAERQIQRQVRHLKALRTIDLAISSSFDLQITLNILINQVISQLNVDAADVLLFDQPAQMLTYAASSGFRSNAMQHSRLRVGEGYAGRAIFERRIIHIPNVMEAGGELVRALILKNEAFVTYFGVPLIVKGQVKGVLETFHRTEIIPDQEWLEFLEALAGLAAIAVDNAQLFQNLNRSNLDLLIAYDATLEGWSRAMDLRDRETEGHTQRVTEMALRLAQLMGMSESDLINIRRGGMLHDIGKLGIPDKILLKADTLTLDEWKSMQQHPKLAYEMLAPITFLKASLDIPYCHHEKWDGSGYPRGLKGEQIPFAARIFSIVDVWDAVTSDRPYREAWSKDKALGYVKEQSGKYFDPQVVEAFLKMMESDLYQL